SCISSLRQSVRFHEMSEAQAHAIAVRLDELRVHQRVGGASGDPLRRPALDELQVARLELQATRGERGAARRVERDLAREPFGFLVDGGQLLDDAHGQNATLLPPLSFSISRASSGVAMASPSSSSIRRIFVTCSAFVFARVPRPSQRLSSNPTLTFPPITADCAATNIWLRPAPSTDHRYWSPKRRSAVRFMCSTSSGCGPMPPRMPKTDWMNKGGLTSFRSRKCAAVYKCPMS